MREQRSSDSSVSSAAVMQLDAGPFAELAVRSSELEQRASDKTIPSKTARVRFHSRGRDKMWNWRTRSFLLLLVN